MTIKISELLIDIMTILMKSNLTLSYFRDPYCKKFKIEREEFTTASACLPLQSRKEKLIAFLTLNDTNLDDTISKHET